MRLPIFTVDAFTKLPFSGNPAAVCLLEKKISDDLMQNIATEIKLSETAFLQKIEPVVSHVKNVEKFETSNNFNLRWFTPTHEVALCGHATLSTAAVLFFRMNNTNAEINFHTLSGCLTAKRKNEGITLDFPLNPPVSLNFDELEANVRKLIDISRCNLNVSEVLLSKETKKLLLRLSDNVTRKELENINPSTTEMMKVYSDDQIMGVILTLQGNKENGSCDKNGEMYDFVSRYFAPWHGIDEDPVTGSAHTVLAGYWATTLGKSNMYARQCSKRGGEIRLQVKDDGRVYISGEAVIVMEGVINVP
ncbi:PBLD (predicted) [Pycnogonum litorale]